MSTEETDKDVFSENEEDEDPEESDPNSKELSLNEILMQMNSTFKRIKKDQTAMKNTMNCQGEKLNI